MDAIEETFVPLAIKNNVPGPDAEALARYEEPTWNNPVVRFFAHDGSELLPRRDRVWEEPALVARVVAALDAAEVAVPGYLALLAEETSRAETREALFSMY